MLPLRHLRYLVDVHYLVGHQFLPLVERRVDHGGIFGVGAVDGGGILAEVLLGAPLWVVGLARAFCPAVAVAMEGDALDAQPVAALLEFCGPVA